MSFDLSKLPKTLEPVAAVNGALYERLYRRFEPKWYSPFCRHGAFSVYSEDPFPVDPTGEESHIFQVWTLKDSTDQLLLISSQCLVCRKKLLEGRLRRPDGNETSVGTLYLLAKDKSTPPIKDISDEVLLQFYEKEWEFITSLLADFNKLTIAIAVAAAVFFDRFASVFYAFIVACFILIALYAVSYAAQKQITRKYYRDAGKTLAPTYKTLLYSTSRWLQAVFAIAIIVVLCVMIRAERISMKDIKDDVLQKTHPYNPPTKTIDTQPFNPAKIEPALPKAPQTQPDKTQTIQPEKKK